MDPATVIALCKENIQPLRHGRNATQLGTALRAQDDVEAQQLLQQERQMYEDAIKNYVGDDPIENWYDYISWVEQSFPKSGHESPLAKLLQQCLTNFEKETKYHQDRRFIRLWINYISMQKNPLELYQLLYNNGIGTMIADLYRAWAFELEQAEDFKRADEVYMIGLNCRAEPREELDFAHKNFQLAVARKMLGRNDERSQVSLAEQRQAFTSLKAIRAGKKVGSIRTGHRVRDFTPGAIPQMGYNAPQKSNAAIQIYQDENLGDMKGSSILDHVPIEEAVHKENTIKPGPWNNNSRKCPLISSAVKPSFKVHEDTEEINMDKIRLFPNHVTFFDDSKYEEQYAVPVFVPDVPNPNIILKPHYPKDLVYANNGDRSIEQIKALKYLERRQNNIPLNSQMQDPNNIDQHSVPKVIDVRQSMQSGNQLEELERQNAEKQRLEQQQREAELERQRLLEQQQRESELERQRQIEQQQREAELERQRQQQQELECQRQEAELKRQMYEAEQKRLEAERLQQQQQQNIQNSSYMSQHHSLTTDEQHLMGQSMTVNTKEAMSAVQDLWQSPSSNASGMMSPIVPRMASDSRNKLSFDIHMDSSMTQNAIVSNKMHHQRQQQQSFGPVPTFNDQENRHFHNSFPSHEHQSSYGNHSVVQNSFHYPMQPHQEPHLHPTQQPPHQVHPEHHQQHLQSPHHHQAMMQQQQQQHPQHHLPHQQVSPMMPPPHQLPHHQRPMHHQSPSQHHVVPPQHQHHYPQHMQMPVQHIQQPQQQPPHMQHPQQLAQQHMNTSQHLNMSQHMNSSQHINASQHINTSQHLNSSQHMNTSGHLNTSQHMQHHPHLPLHHPQHPQHPLLQPPPHVPHPEHTQHVAQQQSQQHHLYNNVVPNTMGYPQPYAQPIQTGHASMEEQKQVSFSPYVEPSAEGANGSKPLPYRMPPELPLIKSPGMNRRDLKYLENAENKENAADGLEYNGLDESIIKQQQQQQQLHQQPGENSHLYSIDESLGISLLPGVNETCYTETFNRSLIASTPMTNHFKAYKQNKDISQQQPLPLSLPQQHQQMQQPPHHSQYANQAPPPAQGMPVGPELGEKLSVIMESTREYVSSSSASSGTTRTGFTITREDLPTIKEQSTMSDTTTNEHYLGGGLTYEQQQHAAYEQKMRAHIQAVHAQSPRTVQRNVDQITTDIKTNCDLRKSIGAPADTTTSDPSLESKPALVDVTMDCEYNQEPMEQVVEEPEVKEEEPPFELPEGDINPFDKNIIAGLLRRMKFPQKQHVDGYVKLSTNLVKFVPSTNITLGNDLYELDKCLGKGTYGTVFKGTEGISKKICALKTQKPAWVWEYYISREIKTRLTNPHMLRGFMDVHRAYIADNGSVLVTEFSKYGTLLEVTNRIKISSGKPLSEPLAIFFTIEMIQIVEYLHKCQIIHADIKPDNFLLMHMPSEDVRPTIQLIDFGCSIDMTLFPEGTKFTQIIKTEDFTCIEMQTGKPWTYQTDLYCLAASSHCLLFGIYMRVSMNGKKWYINSKLPRYAKKAVWEQFFTELLNIESCENLPDLGKLRNLMEEAQAQMPDLQSKLRQLSNVLNHR